MNIIVMWLFHWTYGVLAVLSSFILMGLNMWMEVGTRGLSNKANRENIESSQHTQRNLRNVEAIEAMGMLNRLRQRRERKQSAIVGTQSKANAKSSLVTTISKVYRMTLQSLALGLGAYLVITKEITPGAMFAGSMLLGRALAPLDLLIASWKGFVSARESYFRLEKSLQSSPSASSPMPLPPPSGHITLNNVTVIPQGEKKPILAGVNLQILPGEQIAVIGPSAAGKSTLIRTLLGLYKTSKGSVRMDGAEIQQWDRETLGNSIGFLPQDVELLDGTVSENIARFGEIDSEKVINATTMAGIHHIILSLPDGYDTKIEGQGAILSAGQRQRLGLARALYNLPKIIILDEPNSNLDQEGEQALAKVLLELKNIGSTVIVVTHRPNLLGLVDKIILMRNAQVVMFGSRDDILKALNQGPTQRIK